MSKIATFRSASYALVLTGCTLALASCGDTPPRRATFHDPVGPDGIARPVPRPPNQVQTVIGEDRQATLLLAASDEWEAGQRLRLRRDGVVMGTALVLESSARGATARVISLTRADRPINPGDQVEPIEVVVAERPAKSAAAAPGTAQDPPPPSEPAVAAGERAYYELAAKVLRLPADSTPEVRRLQEELRKQLTPALVPEAK